ncbi:MAG: copper chaperone PCu(A)C [Acidimicrobiia bacterium]
MITRRQYPVPVGLAAGILALTACSSSSTGPKRATGDVRVTGAWARDTAGQQTSAAVYLTVVNGTDAKVTLTGVSVPASIAAASMIHRSTADSSGMTSMHEVGTVSVPAHHRFRFASGGYHIMLTGLAAPLRAGRRFPITLARSAGAPLRATVTVRGL